MQINKKVTCNILILCAMVLGVGSASLADDTDWQLSGWQGIDLMDGQGLTGHAKLVFSKSKGGDVKLTIAEMNLSYSKGAHYNNIDDSYASLPLVGFLSILSNPKSGGKPIDHTLTPLSGSLDADGNFSCTDCASFILGFSKIKASQNWTSGIVVGRLLFGYSLQMPASLLLE